MGESSEIQIIVSLDHDSNVSELENMDVDAGDVLYINPIHNKRAILLE